MKELTDLSDLEHALCAAPQLPPRPAVPLAVQGTALAARGSPLGSNTTAQPSPIPGEAPYAACRAIIWLKTQPQRLLSATSNKPGPSAPAPLTQRPA